MSANNTPRTPPAVPVGQKEAKRAPGGAMLNRGGSFIDNFRTKKSVSEKSKLEEEEKKIRAEKPTALGYRRSFRKDFKPENNWEDGEERAYLDPSSLEDTMVKELISSLVNWLNRELVDTRIKIEDLENDLSDGLVFKNLVEKLADGVADITMPMGELVHSEERQRRNLSEVVSKIEEITGVEKAKRKWSANAIFDKNLLSIIFFLLHIVEHFMKEGKILGLDVPRDLKVKIVRLKRKEGAMHPEKQTIIENLTRGVGHSEANIRTRDRFDLMMDHDPDKVIHATKEVLRFANQHLEKLDRTVSDIKRDFRDGVNMILLVGMLEGFFLPLYCYNQDASTAEEMADNWRGCGIQSDLIDNETESLGGPNDLARGDLKATLRILYSVMIKYEEKKRRNDVGLIEPVADTK